MLDRLRSIVQKVNAAKDLQSALDIIVSRVRDALDTQVCSVFLFDADINSHVLMASEGLRKEAIGHVSLQTGEGLVGLVAKHAEPLNLQDAALHPSFHYLQDTGEEDFHSFLGVPIIHHRSVLGVLVVQHEERRRFDESEEAFLITLSAQLAGVIAHAEATGAIEGISPSGQKTSDTIFTGISGSSGVAIGQAVIVFPHADLRQIPQRRAKNIEKEIAFFNSCLQSVRDDMRELHASLEGHVAEEERQLFDVYVRMLDDNALGNEVVERIKTGSWAQGALAYVANEHIRNFESMSDSYLRERAIDIKDLCSRVLFYLQEKETIETEYHENTILVSEELTPAMLAEAPKDKLKGLISIKGSGNSHVAILARTMGIPTVMGVVDLPSKQLDGKEVILDGYKGEVIGNPSDQLRKQYQDTIEEQDLLNRGLENIKDLPCETPDSHRVHLWVNTGLMTDVIHSLDQGAEGIGLFRTEVPFLLSERFPSEQEQFEIYHEQLEAFAPKLVTMRTLDVGGDKSLPYFPIEEANPFLGWRGIRVTLDHPEIFTAQIRAMLRASVGLENLQIMLPMISNIHEVTAAKQLIKKAYRELIQEGVKVKYPPVGVMIELPAAVYQIRTLAKMVDFVSVGSNDLTQYLLAVDRNNPRVANLYSAFHPAVLAALQQVVTAAKEEKKPVSICGEMAGDPGAAILLMAMGYDVLSMNASTLLKVKSVIRSVTMDAAQDLLDQVMELDDAQMIRSAVDLALFNAGVDRLLRSSRTN
ncbi:MAG: phosphoenolpyruvate--protein phosphotransferase [Gammaproteobacteria bacterium]|jgi:phosphotransferase system enzyme I (PtsP)|nr:phosphoenolpyruvate--protein phosphotransferase [Gammaproteobacteria bacterium]MBT3860416.1 phosphoenolpyruvate--protein phosphotransferase [Gammaproteobacteria bacterium]MBT3988703.1 phosphoenolpyruvate--protein phosphotransferase [Gammaproteobacteria bacterium]MBT4581425.1 phosphoenolpyruvate--protein phosphotransferase [Gammaproteobacteria bacterium]MBT4659214.1 phosphoenolpyruvate--protein phosphotransferase [Gammaproteobacteria bacterium]